MADSEIKEILEEFSECGIVEHNIACVDFARSVLDLINRQNAEIENYVNNLNELTDNLLLYQQELKTANAEIERLTKQRNNAETLVNEKTAYITDLHVENEKLKKAKYIFSTVDYCADDLDKALEDNKNLKAEIQRLQNRNITNCRNWQTKYNHLKAKAYKEFAERLKEHFKSLEYKLKTDRKTVKVEELKEQTEWLIHTVAIETIDNLLKELVGEE